MDSDEQKKSKNNLIIIIIVAVLIIVVIAGALTFARSSSEPTVIRGTQASVVNIQQKGLLGWILS